MTPTPILTQLTDADGATRLGCFFLLCTRKHHWKQQSHRKILYIYKQNFTVVIAHPCKFCSSCQKRRKFVFGWDKSCSANSNGSQLVVNDTYCCNINNPEGGPVAARITLPSTYNECPERRSGAVPFWSAENRSPAPLDRPGWMKE